ncbi:MAG TPA: M90 family metallopeptidase [Casimicrobiaceae bacterium]|jgi:Mlc titration factor MtfA (ptsG expression regulator)|nr:M90 family metallopeptidase [Casimicrobiaceae bacterium]
MFEAIRRWRERRILSSSAIPEDLWREALEALPFLAVYTEPELERLRERVVLFLNAKSIVGAERFEVTPLMRAMIAIQACVLTLNLDQRFYDGWENVIVYPEEFVTNLEYEDDAGVVHRRAEPLAGEAMPGGPVVLSWPDIEASADWSATGMNLVIHEFAHKIDMRNGEANGFPPLPPEMPRRGWQKTMSDAYAHFRARVEKGEDTAIDPYAAESPAEFFAVLSEVFFADPTLLRLEYPRVYQLFAQFYRQDPASRTELLLEH